MSAEMGYTNHYVAAIKNMFNAIEVDPHTGETLQAATRYTNQEPSPPWDGKYFLSDDEVIEMGDDMAVIPPGMMRGSALLPTEGEYVPFWTKADNGAQNLKAEQEVIAYFAARPNTLSVRDVRAYNVPWSIEVVGKVRSDVQHIRILCEHELDDIDQLPYELERAETRFGTQVAGWAEHEGIDFLAFYASKSKTLRLVNRARLERFMLAENAAGETFPEIERLIPRDPYGRKAIGLLVSLDTLMAENGIVVQTVTIGEGE